MASGKGPWKGKMTRRKKLNYGQMVNEKVLIEKMFCTWYVYNQAGKKFNLITPI